MGARRMVGTGMFGSSVRYLLRDDFNDTVAAGSVNGTSATPTGGARTIADTNNKISIGAGVLAFATGGVNTDKISYSQLARVAGRTFLSEFTPGNNAVTNRMGWDGFGENITTAATSTFGVSVNGGAAISVGVFGTGGDSFKLAVVMRATGAFYFIRGGTFTSWTLVYVGAAGTAARTPSVQTRSTTSIYSMSSIRVPDRLISIRPIASDGFGTSETLGNTRGSGSEESGGSGLAYTKVGTWASNGTVAACSELSGSVGIAVAPCGTPNVMAEVVATRSAGTSGLCLRYTDASNYIKAVHNGTNLQVIEVVAGTPNTLINTAATYGATKRLIISLSGTAVRAYYGDVLVNTATTAIATGNNHGLFTDDIGATFDNLVVWAQGVGGEYESTFNRYSNF
jgi:hypothetical protein